MTKPNNQTKTLQSPGRNALIAGVGTFIGTNAMVFLLASAAYFMTQTDQDPSYKELVKTAYFMNPAESKTNPVSQANGLVFVLTMIGALKAAGEVYEDTQIANEQAKQQIGASQKQR